MYRTAGGDVVEHTAPRERSSNTARGSGIYPRDKFANTSPSPSGNHGSGKKEELRLTRRHTSFVDGYLGVQTSLRTGPCPRKANSELADCHIRTPPLARARGVYRCLARIGSTRRCPLARTHPVLPRATPHFTASPAQRRGIKLLLSRGFSTGMQDGSQLCQCLPLKLSHVCDQNDVLLFFFFFEEKKDINHLSKRRIHPLRKDHLALECCSVHSTESFVREVCNRPKLKRNSDKRYSHACHKLNECTVGQQIAVIRHRRPKQELVRKRDQRDGQ